MTLTCSDPRHALRSALPGWAASLGEGTVAITGLMCDACAQARASDATVDEVNLSREVTIREDGDYVFRVPLVYVTGEVLDYRRFTGKIGQALTVAERDALRALLVKLRQAAS